MSVVIAHLLRPRGNKGELSAIPLSENKDRFITLKRVFLNGAEYGVERAWWHGGRLVFKFAGIDSIEAAEAHSGQDVSIALEDRITLEDGAYFHSDLVGCEVFEHGSGHRLGVVTNLQDHGGPPLLEVEARQGKEILIPFAGAICVRIDVAAKRIEVELPEGLRELNPS